MERAQLRNLLDDLHRRLETTYGDRLVKLVLFGSHARGEADPESDVDVLMVLQGEVDAPAEIERTIGDVIDVSSEYDVLVGCVFVSRESMRAVTAPSC
jgi:predicted nucleotidyltransferase